MSILKSVHTGQVRVSTQELPKLFTDGRIHYKVFTDENNKVFAKLSAERGITIPINAQTFPCRPVFEGKPKVVLYGFMLLSHFTKLPSIEELRNTTESFVFNACEFSPEQSDFVWHAKDHITYSEIYLPNELTYDEEYDEVVMEGLKEKKCYTQKFLDILVNQHNTVYVPERIPDKFRGLYMPADQWFDTWPYEWKRLEDCKLWLKAKYAKKIKEMQEVNNESELAKSVAKELEQRIFGEHHLIAPNKLKPLQRSLP